MAFQVTLTGVSKTDQSLTVEVLYEDTDSGFSLKKVLNFNNSAVTVQQVKDEAIKDGTVYKTVQSTEATLKAAIGTVVTI